MISKAPTTPAPASALTRLTQEVRRQCGISISGLREPPPNGLTNTVYIAERDAGKVALRVSSPDEIHTYRKEANVAAHAHKLGVRTPRVLGIGNTDQESFHVSQFIPGHDLNSSLVPNPSDAWRQVGEMARRLHSCRIPFNTPEWRPDASL